jgi:hypothetical protein
LNLLVPLMGETFMYMTLPTSNERSLLRLLA